MNPFMLMKICNAWAHSFYFYIMYQAFFLHRPVCMMQKLGKKISTPSKKICTFQNMEKHNINSVLLALSLFAIVLRWTNVHLHVFARSFYVCLQQYHLTFYWIFSCTSLRECLVLALRTNISAFLNSKLVQSISSSYFMYAFIAYLSKLSVLQLIVARSAEIFWYHTVKLSEKCKKIRFQNLSSRNSRLHACKCSPLVGRTGLKNHGQ
jgi:hypothetical protein